MNRTKILILALSSCLVGAGCAGNKKKVMKENSYLDDKVTARRVENVLHHNASYNFPQVHATSINGIVHLTGQVDTVDEKNRATQLAHHVRTANEVSNDLVVAPSSQVRR
jgi:osmotically-inducible protein OsmY